MVYDTPAGRDAGRARGRANLNPTLASGWAHPDGGSVPSWSDEAAAAGAAPAYVHKDAARQRAKQLEVSKARVLLTDRVANEGRRRPDPSVIAAQMRAAKARARTSA